MGAVVQARRRWATPYGAKRRSATGRSGEVRRREAVAFTCGAMMTCGRAEVRAVAVYGWMEEEALAAGDGQGKTRGRAYARMTRADARPGMRRA